MADAAQRPTPSPSVDSTPWLSRRGARSGAIRTVLCLGLDPDPATLPDGFSRDVRGVEAYARAVLDAALPHVAAVKPNLAFYEAFGSAGIAALERIRAAIPPDVPFLVDAKRGDIGTTAARQAAAILDGLGAHAVTLSPYLGRDAVDPFLKRNGVFVYLICRTSNPAASEIQNIDTPPDTAAGFPREPLYARVARVTARWADAGRLGFVVGATAPDELAALRDVVPDRAFLVPGIGAQGGDLEATLRYGPATSGEASTTPGGGLLVNVSRGISGPPEPADPADLAERIAARASSWAARTPVLSSPDASGGTYGRRDT
jgi:orotidine 5'-phosphate decarboxylase subfamily 2